MVLESGIRIGLTPNEIDDMTLYQLNKCVEGYTLRTKEEYKTNICYSFYTAYFNAKSKSKEGLKDKDLKDVLNSIDNPKKKMTGEEMAEMARLLNRSFGGEEVWQET